MKRTLKTLICIFLIIFTIMGSTAIGFAVNKELADFKKVLLIQDRLPWDSSANFTVLEKIKASYDVVTTSEFNADMLDDYGLVILANDQTTATYDAYSSFTSELEEFTANGGTVVYGACDEGWGNGVLSSSLPGGVQKSTEYHNYNYIADSTHPIVTGELTNNEPLTNEDLFSNYCSHVFFDESTLPEGSTVILRSSANDAPTLVEYPYGDGYIIASGLTWEHNFVMHTGNDGYGTFALKAMDDMFLYAISYYNSVEEEVDRYRSFSDFTLGRDNNNFVHTNVEYESAGFKGATTYTLRDTEWNRLKEYAISQSEINSLKSLKDSVWKGSCYGIASTMGLLFSDRLSADALSNKPAGTKYFSFAYPYNDLGFMSKINFYQLSQMLTMGGKIYAATAMVYNPKYYNLNDRDYNYDLTEAFLRKLVKAASKEEVLIFGYSYKTVEPVEINGRMVNQTKTYGHAILITGCEFDGNEYKVRLYDENSVRHKGAAGEFMDMIVSKDFSTFRFEDANGTAVNNDNYMIMYFLDMDKMPTLSGNLFDYYNYVETENTVFLCDTDHSFILVNEEGKTLSYDGVTFSGDMEITEMEQIEKSDAIYMKFTLPECNSFTLSEIKDGTDMQFYTDDDFISLKTQNAETASLTLGEDVTVDGDDFKFDIAMSTDAMIDGREGALGGVSADAKGLMVIGAENSDIVCHSDETMCNVTQKNYIENEIYTKTVDEAAELVFDSTEKFPSAEIRNMSKYDGKTLPYHSTITFYADTLNCESVTWHVEGAQGTQNDDGSFTVKKAEGNFTVYCEGKGSDGTTVKSSTESIRIQSGIINRIISFLSLLFDKDKYTYEQN